MSGIKEHVSPYKNFETQRFTYGYLCSSRTVIGREKENEHSRFQKR